jgi:hypothetical protein
MTNPSVQRRHDEDVIPLGDRVADELLRLSLADEVVQLPVVAEATPQHRPGSAYGCPACQAATALAVTPNGMVPGT